MQCILTKCHWIIKHNGVTMIVQSTGTMIYKIRWPYTKKPLVTLALHLKHIHQKAVFKLAEDGLFNYNLYINQFIQAI